MLACLLVWLPVCLFAYLPACLSVFPPCLSVCLHACLPVCLPACLFACLPICLSICLSVCLPARLSACLPDFLSSCLPVWLWEVSCRRRPVRPGKYTGARTLPGIMSHNHISLLWKVWGRDTLAVQTWQTILNSLFFLSVSIVLLWKCLLRVESSEVRFWVKCKRWMGYCVAS